MIKKALALAAAFFVLAACAPKKPKIDFVGPTSGPDLQKLTPTVGPNAK